MSQQKKIVILALVFMLSLAGCKKQEQVLENNSNQEQRNTPPVSSVEFADNRLEVYYFHSTARCASCTIIENYVNDVIYNSFLKEVEDGVIDFRTINIDLPENKNLVEKFKATGSSLYLNKVMGEQEEMEFYADVWRYFGDEKKLKDNLEAKIKNLLQF